MTPKPSAYLVTDADSRVFLYLEKPANVSADCTVTELFTKPAPVSEGEEKAKFEAWFKPNFPNTPAKRRRNGKYTYAITFDSWPIWQAAKHDALKQWSEA